LGAKVVANFRRGLAKRRHDDTDPLSGRKKARRGDVKHHVEPRGDAVFGMTFIFFRH